MPYDGYVFPKKNEGRKNGIRKVYFNAIVRKKNALLENHRKMMMILIF